MVKRDQATSHLPAQRVTLTFAASTISGSSTARGDGDGSASGSSLSSSRSCCAFAAAAAAADANASGEEGRAPPLWMTRASAGDGARASRTSAAATTRIQGAGALAIIIHTSCVVEKNAARAGTSLLFFYSSRKPQPDAADRALYTG